MDFVFKPIQTTLTLQLHHPADTQPQQRPVLAVYITRYTVFKIATGVVQTLSQSQQPGNRYCARQPLPTLHQLKTVNDDECNRHNQDRCSAPAANVNGQWYYFFERLSKLQFRISIESRYLGDFNTFKIMLDRPLILASSSVYRRGLLARLQLDFTPVSPDIDESPRAGELPATTALRLALAKAQAIATLHPHALVIGSDQVADLNGAPLGKPGTHENALRQLRMMRSKRVVFHTALCLLDAASGRRQLEDVPTTVHFRELSDAQIERYLQLEQPYDCAGSAKIENLGVALVHKIESDDPTAVIGLPLMTLVSMLKREQVEVI